MAPNLASCLFFAVVVKGYETFETRCTGPSTTVNFVSSADKRGTLDILFSCLFTLVACTWTVQHLNVPEQREGRDPGWLGNIKWTLKRAWTSTKWMLITVLAPEYLLAKGLSDRQAVDSSITKLQKIAAKHGVPWTRVHSQFANVGGFVIKVDGVDGNTVGQTETVSRSSLYHLTIFDILALSKHGLLEQLPSISEEEINDKSKSDGLVRAIAIVQIAWMALQIIARASRRLAISQLEISVFAFASCAVVIYGLNWERPKGVQVPYTLLRYQGNIPAPVLQHLRSPMHESMLESFVGEIIGRIKISDARSKTPGAPLLNHVSYFTTGSSGDFGGAKTAYDFFGLIIGSAIFGAIHITAWNFAFPTSTERVIWRVASIYCTSPGFLFVVMAVCLGMVQDSEILPPGDLLDNIFIRAFRIICFGYVVVRLFLIVETFRTLCFLPPSAYIATWASSNVPHVA
jgi:hypothetical protein